MIILIVRITEFILLAYFLASFIPSLRNYFKKQLKSLYIGIGICLLVVDSIMILYVFPRLVNLYKETSLTLDYQKLIISQVIGLILSFFILVIGIKIRGSLNDRIFYLLFGFLIILFFVSLQLTMNSIIEPIDLLSVSLE